MKLFKKKRASGTAIPTADEGVKLDPLIVVSEVDSGDRLVRKLVEALRQADGKETR